MCWHVMQDISSISININIDISIMTIIIRIDSTLINIRYYPLTFR